MSRWRLVSLCLCPLLCCAVVGCSNQPGAMPNPFVQVDRVPPPATRMPAPGTATPSYGSWPQAPVPGAAPATFPAQPPASGAIGAMPELRSDLLATTGATVGIPRDDQALRFDLPQAASEQPIVELAARDLPPGIDLGQPAAFVPPQVVTPTSPPRIRLPGGSTSSQVPIVPSSYQPAGQIRQRPAIQELPDQAPLAVTPVVDQTADGFRPRGSAREVLGDATPTVPREFAGQPAKSASPGYGYGPSYQQLRGRIEFSPAIGHWKLRYIPIDGASDEFGGSVIIANPHALTGFQAGDWAMVEGQLQATPNGVGGYTALFSVTSIARQ